MLGKGQVEAYGGEDWGVAGNTGEEVAPDVEAIGNVGGWSGDGRFVGRGEMFAVVQPEGGGVDEVVLAGDPAGGTEREGACWIVLNGRQDLERICFGDVVQRKLVVDLGS